MAVLTASVTGLSLGGVQRALNASYTGKFETIVPGRRKRRTNYTDWLMFGRHFAWLLAIRGLG